ncbi:hypothetical protein [Microbacterium sp. LWS13-1.2]|uniref:Uncharacterized protein n=1 Tax=Microbacterium sp. LWS13-1.2 TaxID=3135264 RepID=A0AAU6SFR1_9MICO
MSYGGLPFLGFVAAILVVTFIPGSGPTAAAYLVRRTPAADAPEPNPAQTVVAVVDPGWWDILTLIVSGLGAVGTILVAVLALVETKRAGRLEDAARTRGERARFAEAAVRWIKSDVSDPALTQIAATVSADAERVAEWLILQTKTLADIVKREHASIKDAEERDGQESAAFFAEFELMSRELERRVWRWVSSGLLDERPMNLPKPTIAR